MNRAEKNLLAYDDLTFCMGRKDPTMPDDAEYMEFYTSWKGLVTRKPTQATDVVDNLVLDWFVD